MKTQSFPLTPLLHIQLAFVTLFFLRRSKYIPILTTAKFACPVWTSPWESSLKACSAMPGKSEFLTFVSAMLSSAWRQWMIEPTNFFGPFFGTNLCIKLTAQCLLLEIWKLAFSMAISHCSPLPSEHFQLRKWQSQMLTSKPLEELSLTH